MWQAGIIILILLGIVFQPWIDKTPDGNYVLWYNALNAGRRNFIILGKL